MIACFKIYMHSSGPLVINNTLLFGLSWGGRGHYIIYSYFLNDNWRRST